MHSPMSSQLCYSFQYSSNYLTMSKSKLFRNNSIAIEDNNQSIKEFLFIMERREALKEIMIDEDDESFEETSERESSFDSSYI